MRDPQLIAGLRELEPDLLEHLRRLFPDVPRKVSLRFRPLPALTAHHIVVVETSQGVKRRLIIKGPPRYAGRPGRAVETHLLTDVGPRISVHNPSTRCPRVVACYPERQLLLLEMIDGQILTSLLFGCPRLRERARLPELLRLCGEWLARFHGLTQTGQEGNPFEWLVGAFEDPATRLIFQKHGDEATYRSLCDLARRSLRDHPEYRRPLCAIHGGFTPNHVLVERNRIYVFDLELSRIGYPNEDLASFTAYLDILPPWRRALGAWRVPLAEQRRLLLDSYAAHASPLCGPEKLILRLARLLAIARFLRDLDEFITRNGSVTSWLLQPWRCHRFRTACLEELAALREESVPRGRRSGRGVDDLPPEIGSPAG